LQSGPLRKQTANAVAIFWANKDISGVSKWIAQWPEGRDRDEIVTNIAYEAARQKPEAAINLAMDLLPDEPMSKLVIYATSQWATEAPEAAAKWTEQIDDETLRNQALVSVATAWAATDPNAAAQLALTKIPPGRQQQDAVVGIVERSTQIDPKGTADWVEQFDAGSLRDTAIQNMVSIWTDKDPSGAAQWLESLPSGQFRDSAVGAYVNKMAIVSPSEAARWAQTLPPQ
jgi:DNA primase